MKRSGGRKGEKWTNTRELVDAVVIIRLVIKPYLMVVASKINIIILLKS